MTGEGEGMDSDAETPRGLLCAGRIRVLPRPGDAGGQHVQHDGDAGAGRDGGDVRRGAGDRVRGQADAGREHAARGGTLPAATPAATTTAAEKSKSGSRQ